MRIERRTENPAKKENQPSQNRENDRIELLPFMRQSGASARRTTSFDIPIPATPAAQQKTPENKRTPTKKGSPKKTKKPAKKQQKTASSKRQTAAQKREQADLQKKTVQKREQTKQNKKTVRKTKPSAPENQVQTRVKRTNNPPPGKRRKRHRKKRSFLLYYIFFGILLVSILFVLSTTVFFKLETVQITGCEDSEKQAILNASGISMGDNLWQINTQAAEQKILSAFLNYDAVDISRKLPSGITIKMTPSQIDMVCVYQNQYYSMSSGGRISAVSDTAPSASQVPLVYGCDLSDVRAGDIVEATNENKISVLFDVIAAMKESELTGVTHIDVSDITTIRLYWNNQAELKFGSTQGLAYEISCVKKLLEEQLEPEEIVIIDDTLMNGTYYMRPVGALSYPGESSQTEEPEQSTVESSIPDSENSSESEESSGETT